MGKKTSKGIHRAGDILINGLATSLIIPLRMLSPRGLVAFSKVLGVVGFYLLKKSRKRIIENLTVALGKEKGSKDVIHLAREIFLNLTLTPLETIYAYIHPPKKFLLKIAIEGEGHLQEALSRGKGVIALGMHLGPFTLIGARLSLAGYRFNLLYNEGNYPMLWKRLTTYQQKMGQNPFPLKPLTTSLKKSFNCLLRNEILYLIADEQQRRGGIPTPFFGQTAFTPRGPAILSLKTGASILPMIILREERTPKRLLIGPPIAIERTGDLENDIEALTIRFTKVIEEIIRQYPDQWAWLNRRWKQPPSIPSVTDRDGTSC